MNCEECRDAEKIDGVIPDCQTDKGCLVPPLDEDAQRVMNIREKLITLKELVDPGTILRMHNATREDIEMLAAVEEEMKKNPPLLTKEGATGVVR